MHIYRQMEKGGSLRSLVTDISSLVPANTGAVYNIYFDNGGTTPAFNSVVREMNEYTPWYKYVSDKSLKARFLSELYEQGRTTIKKFVHADMQRDTVVYTKNTTEAINILSNVILGQYSGGRPVILTTYMEHMSDYLP
jgi:cysteine desulfurase/selenocysteine lyase